MATKTNQDLPQYMCPSPEAQRLQIEMQLTRKAARTARDHYEALIHANARWQRSWEAAQREKRTRPNADFVTLEEELQGKRGIRVRPCHPSGQVDIPIYDEATLEEARLQAEAHENNAQRAAEAWREKSTEVVNAYQVALEAGARYFAATRLGSLSDTLYFRGEPIRDIDLVQWGPDKVKQMVRHRRLKAVPDELHRVWAGG